MRDTRDPNFDPEVDLPSLKNAPQLRYGAPGDTDHYPGFPGFMRNCSCAHCNTARAGPGGVEYSSGTGDFSRAHQAWLDRV